MMEIGMVLQNAISVALSVGLPVVVLLTLATEMSKWYDSYTDPPAEVFREDDEHH